MTAHGSEAMATDIRQESRLQTLYVVNDVLQQAAAARSDIDVVLPRILRLVYEELRAHSSAIVLVDDELQPQHAWSLRDGAMKPRRETQLQALEEDGLFAWTLRNCTSALIADTSQDKRCVADQGDIPSSAPASVICSPLIIRARAVGAITISRRGVAQFDQEDVDLFNTIAGLTAGVVEGARLYRENQRWAERLSALSGATAVVSSSLELEEVLAGVARQMTQLMSVDGCMLLHGAKEDLQLLQRMLYAPAAILERLGTDALIDVRQFPKLMEVIQSLTPAQLHSGSLAPEAPERRVMLGAGIHSLLLLPMAAHDNFVGLVILLDTQEERQFARQETDLAQMLANQAAIAIENARLYEDTQRQLKASALLNQAGKVINSTLDTNAILQSLLAQMNELLNAEALSIALVDKQTNELVYEIAEGIGSDKILGLRLPSNHGIGGWVMEHGEPALVQDTSQDPRFFRQADERTGHDTRAIICAPLQVKGEVLGTIQAINPRQGTFTEDDLNLWVNLANLASSALANAQQFARTQAAEERYLSLFEDSVNPILLTDLHGVVLEANRRALEFLGFERQELIGRAILALHSEREAAPNERLPQLSGITTDAVHRFIANINTRSQHAIPVEGYVKRTLSGESEVLQWIYRDISQQVELEEMRGDLMAMLVHDLQSPLGNIISSLELLRYELPADVDPVLDSIVDIAARSSRRLQTLIRSLLDITHLEAGHPISDADYVDLNGLVDDAREVVLPGLERRKVELVVDFPEELPQVFVDADMIGRVLINLLENASKHTPETREVLVAGRRDTSDDQERLHISVSDQGQGIAHEHREVIFEKFRRLQALNAPKGMGLGLAFCRLAVEAHGGKIWVDDAPSGGARFNFTLPTKPFPSHVASRK